MNKCAHIVFLLFCLFNDSFSQIECGSSTCSKNEICQNSNGSFLCKCSSPFFWHQTFGCIQCMRDEQCDDSKACIDHDCKDPCPVTCGSNTNCKIVNDMALCTCLPGYTGSPQQGCTRIKESDPCIPSPCSEKASCHAENGLAKCTCPKNLPHGDPHIQCYECSNNLDCAENQVCDEHYNICQDPCPGSCGSNANCKVVNHRPQCSCPIGYVGSPHEACYKDPCIPPPCGAKATCQAENGLAKCTCPKDLPHGDPKIRCYECSNNLDCAENHACDEHYNICKDPCPGSCGTNADCKVVEHRAQCSCPIGYVGSPHEACYKDPCIPPPCSAKATCHAENGLAKCTCPKDLPLGDPKIRCYECSNNLDCAEKHACDEHYNICKDPCPGSCGTNADCKVVEHRPQCSCRIGFVRNASQACFIDPCIPSPCSAKANCHAENGKATCKCPNNLPHGNPNFECIECVYDWHCDKNKACDSNKCKDPCPGTCGPNAYCEIDKHRPKCLCRSGYDGDPNKGCFSNDYISQTKKPCGSSYCGKNAVCDNTNGVQSCKCIRNFLGDPTKVCYECSDNTDCADDRACFNNKCEDPCIAKFCINADCETFNHKAHCNCTPGFIKDSETVCKEQHIHETVSVTIIPHLTDIYKNITIGSNICIVEKLYEGANINLTCIADNLPNNTTITWLHNDYKNKQVSCNSKKSCKVTYEKDFPKEDNNTVARCVVETNSFIGGKTKKTQSILKSVLMVYKLLEETSPASISNNPTESPVHPAESPNNDSPYSSSNTGALSSNQGTSSVALIGGSVVAAIIILIIIGLTIYCLKYRGKKTKKHDQEPIYATPETHYAELCLPSSENSPVVEEIPYAEIIGVLKPKNKTRNNLNTNDVYVNAK